jgi:Family of unknown function (DUF6152)
MKRWVVSTFGIGAVVCAAAAHAHHSIAGVYDDSQRVTVEGTITRFQFVNPHPWVLMEVRDASGTAQQWTLEMDNRHELVDIGFDNATLKSGDRIVVTGSPGRRQPQSLYIRKLDRPADGFSYEQIGSSPSIRRPPGRRN